jgi:hypothetical protein
MVKLRNQFLRMVESPKSLELRVARFGQRIGGNEREAERRLKLK